MRLLVKLLKVPITDCDAGRLVKLYPCSKWYCLRLVPEGRWCDRHRPGG